MAKCLIELWAILGPDGRYYTSQDPHYLGGRVYWSENKAHTWSSKSGAVLKRKHLGVGQVVKLTAARTIEGD